MAAILRHRNSQASNLLAYIFLILVVCFAVAPIVWAVLTSLKTQQDTLRVPPSFFPKPFTLKNYGAVIFQSRAPRSLLNSFILSFGGVLLTLLIALHAAYGTSRFRFRGRDSLLFFILSMAFIPGITILVPLYLIAHTVGLYNTYIFLILVYSAQMVPQITWFVKGFIENIPPSIEEAALIDGCTKWGVLYRMLLPNILGGMLASALIVFVFVWNDFLICTSLTSSLNMQNVQMTLRQYNGDLGIVWGKFMAFNVLAMLPPAIIYVSLHERLVKGLAVSTEK